MKKRNSMVSMVFILLFVCVNCAVVFANGPYIDNSDGTISDLSTGLMWQKVDNGTEYTWQGALAYSESIVLAGHDDWRLPNYRELESIIDISQMNPAINTDYFPDCKSYYWSSSASLSFNYAWYGNFISGSVDDEDKSDNYFVRCVRLGLSESSDNLVISITASETSGEAPLNVSFTSTITSGTAPFSYSWNFGDGSASTSSAPSHTYTNPGSYSATLTVTDNLGQTALKSIQISVTQSGAYYFLTHSVLPAGSGTIQISPDTTSFNKNEMVTLTAVANTGYKFSNWSGDASGSSSTTTITMNSNKSVTAVFNETSDCQAEYEKGIADGRQQCINNPDSCGISGGGASSTISSESLNIHIPSILYDTPFGAMSLWVDFEFAGENNGNLLWKLSNFGENE